ncbi:MAG: DUF1540 domain-containing protein [Anaerolineae bacterium]|nr:DUF1540 domain-containing protein [Anaerolineae bacterium]
MTRVRCYIEDCMFWKKGICQAKEIEIDPDEGCLTFRLVEEEEEELFSDWEEERFDEEEEW